MERWIPSQLGTRLVRVCSVCIALLRTIRVGLVYPSAERFRKMEYVAFALMIGLLERELPRKSLQLIYQTLGKVRTTPKSRPSFPSTPTTSTGHSGAILWLLRQDANFIRSPQKLIMQDPQNSVEAFQSSICPSCPVIILVVSE